MSVVFLQEKKKGVALTKSKAKEGKQTHAFVEQWDWKIYHVLHAQDWSGRGLGWNSKVLIHTTCELCISLSLVGVKA